VCVGTTPLSYRQLTELINAEAAVWPGRSYNLLTRNCNHFAAALCSLLAVHAEPNYVNRAARVGHKVGTRRGPTVDTVAHVRTVGGYTCAASPHAPVHANPRGHTDAETHTEDMRRPAGGARSGTPCAVVLCPCSCRAASPNCSRRRSGTCRTGRSKVRLD
jgi:hypothetical protein